MSPIAQWFGHRTATQENRVRSWVGARHMSCHVALKYMCLANKGLMPALVKNNRQTFFLKTANLQQMCFKKFNLCETYRQGSSEISFIHLNIDDIFYAYHASVKVLP